MCLITEQKKPQIAKEDITCYKVLSQDMTSLFHIEFEWELGKLYETEMDYCPEMNLVSQAFHSYASLQDLRYGYFKSLSPCIMVKCTIPKGSEYYSGRQGAMDGYASNKIIVNEILNVKEVFNDFDWDNYPFKVGQKIITSKGGAIYQILNIQPVMYHEGWADLVVENCITSIYSVIRTKYNKYGTWEGSIQDGTWEGVGVELEILEESKCNA